MANKHITNPCEVIEAPEERETSSKGTLSAICPSCKVRITVNKKNGKFRKHNKAQLRGVKAGLLSSPFYC